MLKPSVAEMLMAAVSLSYPYSVPDRSYRPEWNRRTSGFLQLRYSLWFLFYELEVFLPVTSVEI